MKRNLLLVCMLCCCALGIKADFLGTNYNHYNYLRVHPQYYNTGNTFYVAPLVFTVTGTNEATVSGADMDASEIEIPEKVNFEGKTYRVTSIHGYAFHWCSKLETLIIPKTVSYIYTSTSHEKTVYAVGPFIGCGKLKNIFDYAMEAQGFWNKDKRGINFFRDLKNVNIHTPEGSDYISWAKYANGLEIYVGIGASGYSSLYIEKDLAIPEDESSSFYIMKQNGEDVTFAPVEGYIPANTPVIVKGKANGYAKLVTCNIPEGKQIDVTGNLLKGVATTSTTGLNDKLFIVNKDVTEKSGENPFFVPLATGAKLEKNTAYLTQDIATKLNNQMQTGKVNKKHSDGRYYDIWGNILNEPANGIYLQNGQKKIK